MSRTDPAHPPRAYLRPRLTLLLPPDPTDPTETDLVTLLTEPEYRLLCLLCRWTRRACDLSPARARDRLAALGLIEIDRRTDHVVATEAGLDWLCGITTDEHQEGYRRDRQ